MSTLLVERFPVVQRCICIMNPVQARAQWSAYAMSSSILKYRTQNVAGYSQLFLGLNRGIVVWDLMKRQSNPRKA